MKTGLIIAGVLLAMTIVCGILTGPQVLHISQRYESAAEELLILTERGQWQRAAEVAEAYLQSWEQTVPLLQMLINHDDADDVTASLVRIRSGIRSRDVSLCGEACAELRENARHLYHRDAFTLGNVL